MPEIDPFLRWAGGKSWLIKHFKEIAGDLQFEHYHEPFLGGAAIYFSLTHKKRAYLSDMNGQLIETYIAVRDYPEELIAELALLANTKDDYYRIRGTNFKTSIERAAQFIYLNHTSFNGLYRVNRTGQYNVPYGFRINSIYDIERVRAASRSLKNTNIKQGDFEINKYKIEKNDLVFLDPPYTVSHNNNGFIQYNQHLFSLDDQYRLSKFIDYIKRKGAFYILTNAAHRDVFDIFDKGDRCLELERNSLIGGKAATRAKTSEYIFTNIPGGNNHE